jgi:hypothetical protein
MLTDTSFWKNIGPEKTPEKYPEKRYIDTFDYYVKKEHIILASR